MKRKWSIPNLLKQYRAQTPGFKGNGCLNENDLAEYVDGAISESDRERIERHLAQCGFCARWVAELSKSVGALESRLEPSVQSAPDPLISKEIHSESEILKLAMKCFREGDLDKAMQYAQQALIQDPQNVQAKNLLANLKRMKGSTPGDKVPKEGPRKENE